MTDQLEHVRQVMRIALSAAVPLWIMQLKRLSEAERLELARLAGQTIAEKGDVLQFGSKKKGAAAEVFNQLAKGIAALSFAPGGVTFLGDHWETKETEP